ncbi:MAG TPA: hypothetical protein VFK41_00280 [Nocardioidaceae bacterium]|nr:hypothetical protein [Nocardioidaceae bacterium]
MIVFAIAALIALIVFQLGNVTSETYKDTCVSFKAKISTTQTC